MAEMQLHRNMTPLKLDEENTKIDLGGIVTTLESKKWIPTHSVIQLQILGAYAVMEHNRRTGSRLKFVNTYEGWHQRLDKNHGILHKIHLVATDNGVPGNYEACIWQKFDRPLDWDNINLPLDCNRIMLPLELLYCIPLCPEIEPRN